MEVPQGTGSGGASASDVWSYTTRSLTDKDGFTIAGTKTTLDDLNDLAQSDILSDATPFAGANIDTTISSRSSHSAADVWSYTTRSLTDKAGFTISGTKTTLDDLNDLAQSDILSDATPFAGANIAHLTQDIAVNTKKGVQRTVVFKMVDETDFATPETGLTVTAEISKDGGVFASCTNSVSEIGNGWYKVTLTSTEMTADEIILKCTATGAAQCDRLIITES